MVTLQVFLVPFFRMEWEQRRYEEEMFRWQGHGRGAPGGPFGPGNPGPVVSVDRVVIMKQLLF